MGENATRFRGLVGVLVHDILLNGYPSTLTGPTRLKHLWYAAMHFVWGSLALYDGDVVFLEDDVVPSPDFFHALDFATTTKNAHHLFQIVAMGGWGGENQVAADARTFTMKASSSFPTMGYAFDRMLWREIAGVEREVLQDAVHTDWAESLGKALCTRAIARLFPLELASFHQLGHIKIIQPTLSRVWHIGTQSQVGSVHQTGGYRWPDRAPWERARARFLTNASEGVLLPGMRDVLGFQSNVWHLLGDDSHKLFPVEERHS